MSEELKINDGANPQNENTSSENLEPTSLPSERQEQENIARDWDTLKEKDPKFMEQFKNLEDFKEKYKELHKQYSNTVRDYKEEEKTKQQIEEQQAQEKQFEAQKQETIRDMIPSFVENGMNLTDEMVEKAKEAGIDEKDLKLGAYELKEKVNHAYSVVGGESEYRAMMEWASENLSEDMKDKFDKEVVSDMSEFAIKGLYHEYKQNSGNYQRIQGSPTPQSISGYKNRQELLADRMYLKTKEGLRDNAAQERHKARLKATSDDVVFGRA